MREAEDFEVADGGVYDAGIRALGRVGRVKEAFELARCMTNKGFKCSEHTYVGLLYACCHADKAEEGRAFVVFDAAKADGVVNAKVLGAMASFVLKKGVWADDRVEALVNDMNKVVSENHFGYGIDPQRFVQKLQDLSRLRFDAQIL